MTIFLGLAAWEWTALLKIEHRLTRSLSLALIFLVSFVAYLYFPRSMLLAGCLGWFGVIYLIFKFPDIPNFRDQKDIMKLGSGILLFSPCWVGLNLIRGSDKGLIYIIFIFSLIWMMDTLGYLVGKPWGRHKLVPKLSPGKSIEGVVGGLVFSLILSEMVVYSSKLPFKKGIVTFLLLLLVASFSVIGDLFESLLKRQAGVKDSGKLLPEHGGVLDRLDSTLAVIPFFALALPFMHL